METIIFKAPPGTRAKLRAIHPNVSELLRQSVDDLIKRKGSASAYDKARHLCGMFKGVRRDLATTKDYLKVHGQKKHH